MSRTTKFAGVKLIRATALALLFAFLLVMPATVDAHKEPAPPPDNTCIDELASAKAMNMSLVAEVNEWMDKVVKLEALLSEERAKGKSLEDAKKISERLYEKNMEIDEARTRIGALQIYQ